MHHSLSNIINAFVTFNHCPAIVSYGFSKETKMRLCELLLGQLEVSPHVKDALSQMA